MTKRQMAYNVHNASDDWENVSKWNRQLVKMFMSYLGASDKSVKTKEKYLHNLKLFFQWVLNYQDNKNFEKIKKRDYMEWLDYLVNEQKLSPARVRVLRCTVSSFSNFCEDILSGDEDYPEFDKFRNLILKIKPPVLNNVREKTYLTKEQIEDLLSYCEVNEWWQECVYIAVSFYTGARIEEVLQFKRSDFKEENLKKGYYITSQKRCKGRGSVGKVRTFKIKQEFIQEYLDKYLETRTDDLDDLFIYEIISKGEVHPAKDATIRTWCKRFAKHLNTPVYPHCFRSSIATVLSVEENKDISKIQSLLGHQSSATTQIYIKHDPNDDIEDLFD